MRLYGFSHIASLIFASSAIHMVIGTGYAVILLESDIMMISFIYVLMTLLPRI